MTSILAMHINLLELRWSRRDQILKIQTFFAADNQDGRICLFTEQITIPQRSKWLLPHCFTPTDYKQTAMLPLNKSSLAQKLNV